jgi:hypothetical protein
MKCVSVCFSVCFVLLTEPLTRFHEFHHWRTHLNAVLLNTLRTGDANLRFLRFCITTVKDEWRKSAFLTRAWFPCTSLHNTWSVSPNGPPGRMFEETWRHYELMIYDKYRGKNIRPQCVNFVWLIHATWRMRELERRECHCHLLMRHEMMYKLYLTVRLKNVDFIKADVLWNAK